MFVKMLMEEHGVKFEVGQLYQLILTLQQELANYPSLSGKEQKVQGKVLGLLQELDISQVSADYLSSYVYGLTEFN